MTNSHLSFGHMACNINLLRSHDDDDEDEDALFDVSGGREM